MKPTTTTHQTVTDSETLDHLTIAYTPPTGQPRRIVFTTTPETAGWLRIESRWTGSGWRERACDRVTDLTIHPDPTHAIEVETDE